MASSAQVANDMAARAGYWRGRDDDLHRACFDASVMIRRFLNGAPPDGRTWNGLYTRLLRLEAYFRRGDPTGVGSARTRARLTLVQLRRDTQP